MLAIRICVVFGLLANCTFVASQSSNSSAKASYVTTGGASCSSSADCGNGFGTCTSFGTCQCWQSFTCPDCSEVCSGVWPSSCQATCTAAISRGGASCTDCMDCFNCDGGQCLNGKCSCFSGWTCPHCETSSEATIKVCDFQGYSGSSSSSSGSSSSSLGVAEIFGIVFAGFIFVGLSMMCLRSFGTDRRLEAQARETRAKKVAEMAPPKLTGVALMQQRRIEKQQMSGMGQAPGMGQPTDMGIQQQMYRSQVGGQPFASNPNPGYPSQPNPYASQPNPYASQQNPFPQQPNAYPQQQQPNAYPSQSNAYAPQPNAYASQPAPFMSQPNPYATQQGVYPPMPGAPYQ